MEILNLEWNQCQLVLKALNKYKTKMEASKQLGLHERSLYRHMDTYEIVFSEEKRKYICRKPPKYLVIGINETV